MLDLRSVDAAKLWLWQAATPRATPALIICIVPPAFDFSGSTLAPPGWVPNDRR